MTKRKEKDPFTRAYDKALRLLGVRGRSIREMTERLEAYNFGKEVIGEVLDRLCEAGLLDDERFAFERARAMGGGKGWGPRKLRWDLARYGLGGEIADRAIERAYGSRSCEQVMRRLVERRFGREVMSSGTDGKLRGKAQRYLLGRGFEPEQVQSVFDPL